LLLEKEMGHVWHALKLLWEHDLDQHSTLRYAQEKAKTIRPYLHHQGDRP